MKNNSKPMAQLRQELYQVMPELSDSEFESLKSDIKERGVMVPVEYDEKGNVLDGHHRIKACRDLGITDWPMITRSGMDEEGKRAHARQLNLSRRHLSQEQRRQLIQDQLKDTPQISDRQIAKQLGVSHVTVAGQREALESGGQIDHLKTSTGADGKTYPRATKPKTVSIHLPGDDGAKAIKEESKSLNSEISKKKKDALDEKKENNKQAAAAAISDNRPSVFNEDCSVFLSRFADRSVDLLITDPPYSTDVDNINSFAASWVTKAISKVKRTGRAFICIGAYPKEIQAYLNILLDQDGFILDNPIIWTYRNTLGVTPKMKYNLNYQVILHLYTNESHPLDTSVTNEMFSVQDINAPDGRHGDRFHKWQKPSELSDRLVRHSAKKGLVVIDPFCCTGTFLISAAKHGCIASGSDISKENLGIAMERGCELAE